METGSSERSQAYMREQFAFLQPLGGRAERAIEEAGIDLLE
jgi:hypothetical protein